jgi:hypothetical protein
LKKIVEELSNNREQKKPTEGSRSVACAVSEGSAGRLVVVGNGRMLADDKGGGAPANDFIGSAIDWLRDKPQLTMEIQGKKYQEYRFSASANETRGLWLPLILAVVFIVGTGASVWVVRRRS